jgi:hypothetical protein
MYKFLSANYLSPFKNACSQVFSIEPEMPTLCNIQISKYHKTARQVRNPSLVLLVVRGYQLTRLYVLTLIVTVCRLVFVV